MPRVKLKSRPDDFQVEELTTFATGQGPFAVYRLTKESLGTPEAITAIAQRWQLKRGQIQYGGLKDRHAVTQQWVTIERGPRRDLEQTHFSLEYQGQADRHFGPHDISGNRFRIVLRDLTSQQGKSMFEAAELLGPYGVPNYFDEQRFGSVGESGEFIARPWCAGDYERALWLAIAEPNPHDRPADRVEKELLRNLWGKWPEAKAALPRSSRRSVVTYLVDHPTHFRNAFALLRVDLRSIYLAAFQSDLWNRILSAWLAAALDPSRSATTRFAGESFTTWTSLSDEERSRIQSAELPLPSARLQLEGTEWEPLYTRVLGERGLELRELRVKYPRDSFFSKGARSAAVIPDDFNCHLGDDERYPGRRRLTLSFVLPRGAYATMLVKRLTDLGQANP